MHRTVFRFLSMKTLTSPVTSAFSQNVDEADPSDRSDEQDARTEDRLHRAGVRATVDSARLGPTGATRPCDEPSMVTGHTVGY